jgi:uncharacterized protein YkwD
MTAATRPYGGSPRATLLALLLAAASLTPERANAQQLEIGTNPANFGVVIWNQTNAYRQANNLPKLARDFDLAQAAQKYADHLARTNTLGHNADGRTFGARVAAEGFQACASAENVYEQWSTPGLAAWRDAAAGAMNSWRNSPDHAKNMKDPALKRLGIGVAAWKHGDRSYYKIVQVFGDDCKERSDTKRLGK